MEKKKEKESILAKKEIDILFVLATLEEAPEKTEILEELELAWQETEKPGRSGRTKNVVKKELDSLGWETETDQEQITDIDTTGIE